MFEVTWSSGGGAAIAVCRIGLLVQPRVSHASWTARRARRPRRGTARVRQAAPRAAVRHATSSTPTIPADRRWRSAAAQATFQHATIARCGSQRRNRAVDQPDRRIGPGPTDRGGEEQARQVAQDALLLGIPGARRDPLRFQPRQPAGDGDDHHGEQVLEPGAFHFRQPRACLPGEPEAAVHPPAVRLLRAKRSNGPVQGVHLLDGERAQPVEQRRARTRLEQRLALGHRAHQAAGSPSDRGSVAAARVPPRPGPPSTSSIAWACPSAPSNGARTSR